MRSYIIEFRDAVSGSLIKARSFTKGQNPDATFTSLAMDGSTNPAALNIELYAPIAGYATPKQGSWLRIWGIGIAEISQGADLEGCAVIIKAGMAKGLPLANPRQFGTIIQARAFQVFGNWQGNDQTLEMQLLPYTGTDAAPANISFNWTANTPLEGPLRTALQNAFPKYDVKVFISDKLVQASDETGTYPKLTDFANYIRTKTIDKQFAGTPTLSGLPYAGVDITVRDRTILVVDGTVNYGQFTPSSPLQLKFEDFVGQPTWIGSNLINFKTVLRGDLKAFDYVRFPQGAQGQTIATPYVLTQPGSAAPGSPSRNNLNFKGVFPIRDMIHFGNFRQADADSWCTSFNASAANAN